MVCWQVTGDSQWNNIYLQGGIIVLLAEVISEGSLSNFFGCKGAADDFLLKEPGLTAGHHLTHLY